MGIYIRCKKCKSDHKLGTRLCRKCGISLANNKKYKVAVKTLDGKRAVRHVDTLSLAKRVESSLKGKVAERKILGVQKAPLLSDVWNQYITWAKMNKKSWRDDKYRWEKHVETHVEGKLMDQLFPKDIENILNKMVKNPKNDKDKHAPATTKHVLVLMKRVYNWAIQMRLFSEENPASRIKPPKVQNEVTECLTSEQLDKLLNILDNWPNRLGAFIVKFALYTGLRQDEVMGLKWKDVDTDKGFMSILDPKGKPTTLPVGIEALEIITEASKNKPSNDCPYVFPNNKGERRVSFYKIWSRIRDAAGLPKRFRFHDLRHTFASYLASSGDVDLYTLQKLLNQQDPKMTQRYAHLLDHALRRGANVADKVFGGKRNDQDSSQ